MSDLGICFFLFDRIPDENHKQVISEIENFDSIEVFYFIDFKNNEPSKSDEILKEINEIESLFSGNRHPHIIKREKNFGLKKNLIEGISEASSKCRRVVVLEDDIKLPEGFLKKLIDEIIPGYEKTNKAMNGLINHISLWSFKREDKIDFYLSNHAHCWGWVVQSEYWFKFINELHDRYLTSLSWNDYKVLTSGYNNHSAALQLLRNVLKRKVSWAIYWSVFTIKNGYKCLTPTFPCVYNAGMDSGENYSDRGRRYRYDDYQLSDVEIKFKKKRLGFYIEELEDYDLSISRMISKGTISKVICLTSFFILKIIQIKLKYSSS